MATEGWSYDAVTVGLPAPIADGRPLIDPVNLGAAGPNSILVLYSRVSPLFWPTMPSCKLWAHGTVKEKCCTSDWGPVWGTPWCFLTKSGLPVVVPMELGHLPYRDGKTFEQCVGIAALKNGEKDWEQDVFKTIQKLKAAMVADFVVLGGGNVKRFKELPADVHRGDNLSTHSWADSDCTTRRR